MIILLKIFLLKKILLIKLCKCVVKNSLSFFNGHERMPQTKSFKNVANGNSITTRFMFNVIFISNESNSHNKEILKKKKKDIL